jgi:RimJ/RimL family protein N-acetyltransferase
MTTIIETERLVLRTWQKQDADAYFQINQDQKVIEFLPRSLTMEQVNDFIPAVNHHGERHGYTLWAAELKETGELMGFIGLNYTDWNPTLLRQLKWVGGLDLSIGGKGFATEGAKASLDYGFKQCGLKEIVSFTVPANVRSLRVMEKIGLKRDVNGDFAHPKLAADHKLSHHVLYRLSADEYTNQDQNNLPVKE